MALSTLLCPKCNGTLKEEEVTMYGKLGFGGRGFSFKAMICPLCAFTELYYKDRSMLL
jgi:predicted nucleic-acid-binding Zn-ribbon protein